MNEQEKKTSNFNIKLDESEERAMCIVEKRDPYKSLGASRRAILRMALILLAQDESDDRKPATKEDLKALREELRALSSAMKIVGKGGSITVEKPPRANAKVTDEDKDAEGRSICDTLGGTVNGRSCIYKKYEVMATGRPVSYDVTDPLVALSNVTVETQYDPSRDAYDRAVIDWKDNE